MKQAWEDAVKKAKADEQAVKDAANNNDLKALRQDVLDEAKAWKTQNDELTRLIGVVAVEAEKVEKAEEALKEEIVTCQTEQYDSYRKTLESAITDRAKALGEIKDLLEAQKVPEVGTAGARCEKAPSNGTMRPRKALGRETVCDEGLCCGAARVW